MSSKLNNAIQLIQKGHFAVLFKELGNRMYSHTVSIGLQRDLEIEFQAPAAKIEIEVRPLRAEDVAELLDPAKNPSVNPRILASQQSMVDANIPSCYVAVTEDNRPCYMQWLIGYNENQKIKKHFKGIFPALKEQEALLEGAYSNLDFRGLRIMPRAMALIAEKAADINARWVNTFVDARNIPSLKGCQRSGFKPYLIRKDSWLLFRQTSSFHPVSEKMDNYFHEVTDSGKAKTGENHQKPKSKKTLAVK